jgi:hypothetical protein
VKRTALIRRTPLKRGSKPIRRTRLRARSAKRAAIAPKRAALVEQVLAERPVCEFPTILGGVAVRMCHRQSTDVHEPLSRGRGGSILDKRNTLAVCREHHDWIHDHPNKAHELGVLHHSWEAKR